MLINQPRYIYTIHVYIYTLLARNIKVFDIARYSNSYRIYIRLHLCNNITQCVRKNAPQGCKLNHNFFLSSARI